MILHRVSGREADACVHAGLERVTRRHDRDGGRLGAGRHLQPAHATGHGQVHALLEPQLLGVEGECGVLVRNRHGDRADPGDMGVGLVVAHRISPRCFAISLPSLARGTHD